MSFFFIACIFSQEIEVGEDDLKKWSNKAEEIAQENEQDEGTVDEKPNEEDLTNEQSTFII